MAIKSPALKKCFYCKGPAKFYNKNRYYCAYDKYLNGYCKNDNKKNSD